METEIVAHSIQRVAPMSASGRVLFNCVVCGARTSCERVDEDPVRALFMSNPCRRRGVADKSLAIGERPPYVAVIRVPINAESAEQARRYIEPYVRDMGLGEQPFTIESNHEFQKSIVDISGKALRVRCTDPDAIVRRGRFSIVNDYTFELIDIDGTVRPLPDNVTELDIRFRPGEAVETRIVAIDL